MPVTSSVPSTRISVILARDSSRAVVLRRGPSKQVRLISWDRNGDSFEGGQWFAGRIYSHRCDLSPKGEFFVYFAGAYKREPRTWTAISRPPYFSALAMWPKGDAWGGGGLFATERHLQLNHGASDHVLADGFELPRGFSVGLLGDHSGMGEDNPIAHARLVRDGWSLSREGQHTKHSYQTAMSWEYTQTQVYAKPSPTRPTLRLERHLHGVHERNGPWYAFSYEVHDEKAGDRHGFGRIDWADWDTQGDLLYAVDGCIHRIRTRKHPLEDAAREPALLIDLRGDRFRNIPPPAHALQWKR